MSTYIVRANIDRYIDILNSDILLNAEKRATIIKLLIVELDKLSHDLEQLEFVESRAANGRERWDHVRRLHDGAKPEIRANTEQLVANVEAIQDLLDSFCKQLRMKLELR